MLTRKKRKIISKARNDLREILKMEGVTYSRIRRELKIDQGHLSRFFSGKSSMSLENLERLANYLGYEITFVKKKEEDKMQQQKSFERERIAKDKVEKVINEIEKLCGRKVEAIDVGDGKVKIVWE